MSIKIKAIYQNGSLRLTSEVNLGENEEVDIVILNEPDDIPASEIAMLASSGKSFDFLESPEEDVYTAQDGEPV